MLEFKSVSKHFGNITAIDGIDLKVRDGEIFGIAGQEDSGKTTILQLAAGLIRPDAGSVYLDGISLSADPQRTKMQIGYVPQHFRLYEKLKVREYMEFYAGFYPIEGITKKRWIQELLSQVNLLEKEEMYVESLSQGMSRRLCVAQALLSDPKLLVLDEPGNGLDAKSRLDYRKVLKNLTQNNKSVLISSHMISDLPEYCASVGILEKGKLILEGSVPDIMKRLKKEQAILIQVVGKEKEAVLVLKQNEYVKKVLFTENGILVTFEGDEMQEADLLRSLVEAGVLVYGFGRGVSDLEHSYFRLISGTGE